jgi:hypothetical protein
MTNRTRFFARIAAALVLGAMLAASGARAGDEGHGAFVTGFEDLPLMPGLAQVADAGTVFDTPSGRVVEAFADGPVAAQDVEAFYAETLPHLGWRKVSAHRFGREGEVLDLEITPHAGGEKPGSKVRFYLSPD